MLGPFFRSLIRDKGLSAVVILTIAVGVGSLTVALGVVDAALWRSPPFRDADRLVMLYGERSNPRQPRARERWSFARFDLLRQSAGSFARLANYSPATVTLSGEGDVEPLDGEIVGRDYFPLVQVSAALGRTFTAGDDSIPGAQPVVILGQNLWRRRFAGDSAILGRTVGVNGIQMVVIGVAPSGFRGLSDRAHLWIPTMMAPVATYADYLTTNQNFISVAARLRDGVSLETAASEVGLLSARINRELPPRDADPADTFGGTAVTLNRARVATDVRRSLIVLLAAVSLLHLLACANVVNLLLGRAAAHRRDTAVRAALGGTSARLVRRQVADGLVLGVAGGGLGVLLAAWIGPLVSVPPNAWLARNFYGSLGAFDAPDVGLRLVAIGILLALVTALVVAWPPALALGRLDLSSGLRDSRGSTAGFGSLRRPSARAAVVTVEAALAVLLAVAAGLMIESFDRMRRAEIGVVPDHLLTFWLRPSDVRWPPARAPQLITDVLDVITRIPGVVSASVDGGAPLAGSANSTLYVMGRPAPARPNDAPEINRHYVGPDHFTTLGIPLRKGRPFTAEDDARHPRVTIISETAARRFWPGEDPLGQRVWFGGGSSFDRPDSSAEIIGIVGDVAYEPLDAEANRASFYTPYRQFTYSSRVVFVRTSGDPAAMSAPIRTALASVNSELTLYDVQTMEERIGASWARHRSDAGLFGAFGLAAVALAAIGIYSVVSYSVAQRVREMGIRLALGARPVSVVRLVVGEGIVFPSIGLGVGTAAALAATRLLRSSLYQVTPTDPGIFTGTVVLLLGVSAVACLVPARRATRVDPQEALRAD